MPGREGRDARGATGMTGRNKPTKIEKRSPILTEKERFKKYLGVVPFWTDDLKVIGMVTKKQFEIIKKHKKITYKELSLTDIKKLKINDEYEDFPTYEWKKDYGYSKELFWKAFQLASLIRGQHRFGKMSFLMPNKKKGDLMFIDACNGHYDFYVCLAPRMIGEWK